jgi:hypothetical protein
VKVVGWIIGIVVAIPCVLVATAISQFPVVLVADSFVKGFNQSGGEILTMTSAGLLTVTSWIFFITYALLAFFILRRILRAKGK